MSTSRTLHPPAAGVARTALIGSADVHRAGFLYVLLPTTIGALLLLLLVIALAYNNLARGPRYPETWT